MATSPSEPAGPQPRQPSPAELAAIVAAVTVAWPTVASPSPQPDGPAAGWRFSGRWWAPDDQGARRRPKSPG